MQQMVLGQLLVLARSRPARRSTSSDRWAHWRERVFERRIGQTM